MSRRDKYQAYAYHGGPYDRGGCDSYYRRAPSPHKFPNGLMGEKVTELSPQETTAYWAGYWDNEEARDFKDWG